MISEHSVRKYCKDDITKIENYDLAVADTSQTWDIHHRLELTLDGEFAHKAKELIRLGMYYSRPYFELIFLTPSDHRKLHKIGDNHPMKGKNHSAETLLKMSAAKKGRHISAEHRQKISNAAKGKNNCMYGKTHTADTIQRMSEARKAYWSRRKSETNK